jgi:hypothetical protein
LGLSPEERQGSAIIIPPGEVVADGVRKKVARFSIDADVVTHADFARFLDDQGGTAPAEWQGARPPAGHEAMPVTGVALDDAARYAAWAGGRLPDEAEWQLAACGFGVGRRYPWGNDLDEKAGPGDWTIPFARRRGARITTPFARSVFGVGGLLETWELTSTAMKRGVVVRGGHWRNKDEPASLSNRSWEDDPAPDVSFRVAYDDVVTWPQASVFASQRPRDEKLWLRSILETRDGLDAWVAQGLASTPAVGSWRRSPDGASYLGFPPAEREFDEGEGYDIYLEEGRLVVGHSGYAGGWASSPSGHIEDTRGWVLGRTTTSMPLESFIALELPLAVFLDSVVRRFDENVVSTT